MTAETSAIDGIYTLAQTVLNVVMAVCILKLKRRIDVDLWGTETLWNRCNALARRVASLEAAERARKELPK